MKTYSHPHRSGRVLLHDAAAHAKQERDGRDHLVVDIAEIDARQVFRQAGYFSTAAYCVRELGLSKKAALHRIHVARVAWRLPAILAALMEGRLHLTTVSMLATHLTDENVDELVEATEGRTKQEIRQLITERFPRRDLFSASEAPPSEPLFVTTTAESDSSESAPACQRRPDGVEVPAPPIQMPPDRFPLKVSLRQETHAKLRHALDLLGHQVPSGDIAEVLDRALDVLIGKLEKRKFAATDKPRPMKGPRKLGGRHVPAEVRRSVWERDGGQCTFVSETGKRCPARGMLEFDHKLEVARGGLSTLENIRLRCRAHNQYTAECTFGSEFMERKRSSRRGNVDELLDRDVDRAADRSASPISG